MTPKQMQNQAVEYYKRESADAYKMALRLSVLPEDRAEFVNWTTYANECFDLAAAIDQMTRAEFTKWFYFNFVEQTVNQPVQLALC